MTLPFDLRDARERERAATTFDRNVVVTAGAGTGKTTLLVDRLVHLLMRDPEPLEITQIVALTFTNKAANEMKLRLRERLQSYLDIRLDREPRNEEEKLHEEIKCLIDRYYLTKDVVDNRARQALRQMERSEIGTIHSFAATLLRLYPMEVGLDPQFREDDGARFERHFEESWALWLDRELSLQGARKETWKQALRKVSLEEMKELAFALCSEIVPLQRLMELTDGRIPDSISHWLQKLEGKATSLVEQHLDEKHQIDRLTGASLKILREFRERGEIPAGTLEEEKTFLVQKNPTRVQTWSKEEFEDARELIRVARRLCWVNHQLTRQLCGLLISFAESCRESFVKEGFVSFDGLLVRARNLVRDHLSVREELKEHFKAILIDEFQDTDPIQYEILLYLAEQTGRQAKDWRKVKLSAGKIFVVGDPKQSIYAFRRADIEAYLEVIQEIIQRQNGIECRLTTNFRSHRGILNVVNGVFEPLISPRKGLQPSYIAIHAPESNGADQSMSPPEMPFRKVAMRSIETGEGKMNANLARRLEAESLTRWLCEEVLGKAEILDKDGRPGLVEPKDVAILLRKLTDVHQYLEPLRRRGIRYVVEGERHFYAAQEVIDAVNLLRAVESPYDRSALVGLLRSPLGGLKDGEIYQLYREDLLDYCAVAGMKRGKRKKSFSLVQDLYQILYQLHLAIRKLPVGEAIARVFHSLPIRLLAAHSFNGEQAVANLEKVRQQAELIGQEGAGTLKEVIGQLQRWVFEIKEEGESALAEENIDAVRILSVHKAKGLEFPVVILAGCHSTIDRNVEAKVETDWSTGLVGFWIGEYWNLPGIFLAEKKRLRDREEQKRVLYVAMTRAREHLMISSAATPRQGESFLCLLEESLGDLSALGEAGLVSAGNGSIAFQRVVGKLTPPTPTRKEKKADSTQTDWKSYLELWQRRHREYEAAIQRPLFLTPTYLKLKRREVGLAEAVRWGERGLGVPEQALRVGDLAHQFLEEWDFEQQPETFQNKLKLFLDRRLETSSSAERFNLQRELEEIFGLFFFSKAYAELRSSSILGREVPLLISWGAQIMEGVIDLVYERNGLLYLADYKTDRVRREGLLQAAKGYHHQVRIYSDAVQQSLQREVAGFKLLFLRLGEALEV
jgi:ATP-dependent helicase/nuclease subunit A